MVIDTRNLSSYINKIMCMELQMLDVIFKISQKNFIEKKDSENTKRLPNLGYNQNAQIFLTR